jgi:hypothetical protein
VFAAKTLLAGVLNMVAGAWGERLETSAALRAVVRSFASLRMTGFGGVISKWTYWLCTDSPANSICAPQCSARSAQL